MRRRWYDQEPSCSRLLAQMNGMPHEEMREFCARVLVNFAEKLRKDMHRKGSLKPSVNSIGVPAITSLYRFGFKKRRWYDKNLTLHKAVGELYMLPPEGLAVLGFKLGDTFGLLQVYSSVCSQVEQEPELADMTLISTKSLQDGKKEAEDVLIAIVGKDLYESLAPSAPEDPRS